MGSVELLIDEEWKLKVVQRYDLRVLLRRLPTKGLERHCAPRWPNCSSLARNEEEEDVFVLRLKAMFAFCLVSCLVMELCFTPGITPMGALVSPSWLTLLVVTGIVLLAKLIAVVVDKVRKMKETELQRKEEVKTISGLIQQV